MSQDDLDVFLDKNRISVDQWNASEMKWSELLAIGEKYEKEVPHFEAIAALLANIIQKFDKVHSVRWRVKDKDHLLSKIVRKCAEGIDKYKGISAENYSDVITDIIGLRAIHLFKKDFSSIHKFVVDSFSLREKAVVYIREGDDANFCAQCVEMGFEVKAHPKGYRSIHYVLSTKPLKQLIYVELQVRTIFEEGWSEIDHMVRYPNYSNDAQLEYLLTIFNRMAGSADEMGGFVNILADELNCAKDRLDTAVRERDESIAKVEALVGQLAAVKDGKSANAQIAALQAELANLKAAQDSMKFASSGDVTLIKWPFLEAPNTHSLDFIIDNKGVLIAKGAKSKTGLHGVDVSGAATSGLLGLNFPSDEVIDLKSFAITKDLKVDG